MRLYAGSSTQFIEDTVRNQIAGKLIAAFREYFAYEPQRPLVASWQNSLRAVKDVFELAKLNDHGVILEYEIPPTRLRLDCLVCGKDDSARENAVIIELKQWQDCEASECPSLVRTWLGGSRQDVPHPSAQARQYAMFLQDNHHGLL